MKTRSQGFTLTEILVVIGVVVLLTGILIPNWRLGEKELKLQRATAKLAQDILRTGELALRVEDFDCQAGSVSGYGIHFDASSPDSYLIFAECNSSNEYEAVSDGVVETIMLENGVVISSVSPSPVFNAVFLPPKPAVYIMPGALLEGVITLQVSPGGHERIVKVNNKGVVDID